MNSRNKTIIKVFHHEIRIKWCVVATFMAVQMVMAVEESKKGGEGHLLKGKEERGRGAIKARRGEKTERRRSTRTAKRRKEKGGWPRW